MLDPAQLGHNCSSSPSATLADIVECKAPKLMGNAVISKNFLRTRKIMVMHSNERGECRPRTLVDCKWKREHNAIDVVVRLHDSTNPSTERTAPPSSAHVQLDDVRRTPIQQSFTGEFRQHDGVMTVMMKLPTPGFS